MLGVLVVGDVRQDGVTAGEVVGGQSVLLTVDRVDAVTLSAAAVMGLAPR